jgi:hypothetical protein
MLTTLNTGTKVMLEDGCARIVISGYFYRVDLGELASPHYHLVRNNVCACPNGQECQAVDAVAQYLGEGGKPTPDPLPGFYPVAPHNCPICGAEVLLDHQLNSCQRGAGWICSKHGSSHYWLALGLDHARRKHVQACRCTAYTVPHIRSRHCTDQESDISFGLVVVPGFRKS